MRSWCGAAVGKREITKLFQVVVVAGRGGEGRGGSSGRAAAVSAGATAKIAILDIGEMNSLFDSFFCFVLSRH